MAYERLEKMIRKFRHEPGDNLGGKRSVSDDGKTEGETNIKTYQLNGMLPYFL